MNIGTTQPATSVMYPGGIHYEFELKHRQIADKLLRADPFIGKLDEMNALDIDRDCAILLHRLEDRKRILNLKPVKLKIKNTRPRESRRKSITRSHKQRRYVSTANSIIAESSMYPTPISQLCKTYRRSNKAVKELIREGGFGISRENAVERRWEEDRRMIENLLKDEDFRFYTASEIKRRLSNIKILSKRRICGLLRDLNLRYRQNTVTDSQRRKSLRKVESTEVDNILDVSRHIVSSMNGAFDFYYFDQFKLVFNQAPIKTWQRKDEHHIRSRVRYPSTVLTCCMICTDTKIVCYQIFSKELRSTDTIFFITSFLSGLQTDEEQNKSIKILLDRARFHTSTAVMTSKINEYLLLNAVKRPELNLIERLFSKVRDLFKCRPEADSLEEEIRNFHKIVNLSNQETDFIGYSQQTLRNIQSLMKHDTCNVRNDTREQDERMTIY